MAYLITLSVAQYIYIYIYISDRLCGLAVRVSGYRSRGLGFDSRRFQIFWEAARLARCPLSLMRTTKELLEGRVSAPVQKTEINDRGNLLRWPRDTLYPQKLALTSPTSGDRSVGIVRSRTKATEFSLVSYIHISSNVRMVGEYWILRDLEGSGRGLIWSTISAFTD
jgi:hypothetical protein